MSIELVILHREQAQLCSFSAVALTRKLLDFMTFDSYLKKVESILPLLALELSGQESSKILYPCRTL